MKSKIRYFSLFSSLLLLSCSDINNSWEVDGGGYIKYTVNGGKSHTIELDEKDVILPDYGRYFFQVKTQASESNRGDQFFIVVNRPKLGKNEADATYSWMIAERAPKAKLSGNKNIVTFDQKDDSTWTANIDLYFQDCREIECNDKNPAIHIEGRLRYWIPLDER